MVVLVSDRIRGKIDKLLRITKSLVSKANKSINLRLVSFLGNSASNAY
jgi:hypothetical protein